MVNISYINSTNELKIFYLNEKFTLCLVVLVFYELFEEGKPFIRAVKNITV